MRICGLFLVAAACVASIGCEKEQAAPVADPSNIQMFALEFEPKDEARTLDQLDIDKLFGAKSGLVLTSGGKSVMDGQDRPQGKSFILITLPAGMAAVDVATKLEKLSGVKKASVK
jgi:hypothetical protein